MENESEHLKVAVRVRPLLDLDKAFDSIVYINEVRAKQEKEIRVVDNEHYITSTYDKVFPPESSQTDIFEFVSPALNQALKGFNCTIFAYGQTGSGKTHTMFGTLPLAASQKPYIDQQGLIPQSINMLFDSNKKKTTYYCSFLQIYNENLYDLLQDPRRDKNLKIRENKLYGIFVQGLAEFITETSQDCFLLLSQGDRNRAVRQTRFNHHSSRSHSIFQMLIESDKVNKRGVLKKAKLNFCDLAGSEKYDKGSQMVSEHVKELTQINKSLSVLGKVIYSLGSGKTTHIPYRDSKLTRLLQDSLGVNTRTILIATVSPAPQYVEETISTLKFADRAKQVMVKVKKNEVSAMNDQLITKLQKEIQHLKTLLNLKRKGGIQELEQKIWVLTEENQKLKTIKHEFTADEVERLKEENKKLRIELQFAGGDGKTEGFYIGDAENTTPVKSPLLSEVDSPRSSNRVLPRSKGFLCEICNSDYPCPHRSITPHKDLIKKYTGTYFVSSSSQRKTDYRSDSSFVDTPKHKSPEIPARMNVRYRMTNYIIEDGGISNEIKKAEARKREMQSIKARLNKISEIENYRKEQFKNELRKLEENRKKEEEVQRKKSCDNFARKRKLDEKKILVNEFKERKKCIEDLEGMRMNELKKEAERKRKAENESKKRKLADFYAKKKELMAEIGTHDYF